TVVSNIGTWMQNAAAGWLMTGLDSDPFMVSLVQVATSLPMFVFALPAGALADIVDRRLLLIVTQVAVTPFVGAFRFSILRGVGHSEASPRLHFPRGRGSGADRAGVAVDRSATGTPATPPACRGPEQRRPQCQPRGRTGARRHHHRGVGHGGTVLGQRDFHAW